MGYLTLLNDKQEQLINNSIDNLLEGISTQPIKLDLDIKSLAKTFTVTMSIVTPNQMIEDNIPMDNVYKYGNEIVATKAISSNTHMHKYTELSDGRIVKVSIVINTNRYQIYSEVNLELFMIIAKRLAKHSKKYLYENTLSILNDGDLDYITKLFPMCNKYNNFNSFNLMYTVFDDSNINITMKLYKPNNNLKSNTLLCNKDAKSFLYLLPRDNETFYLLKLETNGSISNIDNVKTVVNKIIEICSTQIK